MARADNEYGEQVELTSEMTRRSVYLAQFLISCPATSIRKYSSALVTGLNTRVPTETLMSLAREHLQECEDEVTDLVEGIRRQCSVSEVESSTSSRSGVSKPQCQRNNPQSVPVSSQATTANKCEDISNENDNVGECSSAAGRRWPKPRNKTPPIYLHGYKKWLSKKEHFALYDINIKKWTRKSSNVKIELASDHDHQNMVEILEFFNIPYHTYSLAENRRLKVVMRGLPERVSEASVLEELRARGLAVDRVHRMHVGGERRRVPLVLVVLPHTARSRRILAVQQVLEHRVALEPLRSARRQCHRCQKYGHAQRYCRGVVRCVRCAGAHASAACPRDAAAPACANCRRAHPANYRLCARAPKPRAVDS